MRLLLSCRLLVALAMGSLLPGQVPKSEQVQENPKLPSIATTPLHMVARSGMAQTWDGQQLILDASWVDQKLHVMTKTRPGIRRTSFEIPKGFKLVTASEGVYLAACQRPTEGNRFVGEIWESQGAAWKKVFYKKETMFGVFQPLDHGKYLASSFEGFFLGDQGSSFAILKPGSDGQLEVDELVDLGTETLKDPLSKMALPKAMMLRLSKLWKPMAGDLILPWTYRSGDHISVFLKRMGVVLVFSGTHGRLRRKVPLYGSLLDPKLQDMPKEPAFLHAQPLPDGDIFLATRTEDAVLAAQSAYFEGLNKGYTQPGAHRQKIMAEASNNLLGAYGDIHYCTFDPAQGKFTETFKPEGLPSRLGSAEGLKSFGFFVNLEGKIVPNNPFGIKPPAEKPQALVKPKVPQN